MSKQVCLALPLSFGLLIGACKTAAPSASQVKDAAVTALDIKPLLCETGEASSFVLRDHPTEPKLADFKLPPPPEDKDAASLIPLAEMVARLDICVDGEVPTLKRVIFGRFDQPDIVDVVPGSKVEGLSELLFNDDYSALEILVPYVKYKGRGGDKSEPSHEAILVKGSIKGGSAAMLVLSQNGQSWVQSNDRSLKFATVGKFEFDEGGKGSNPNGCPASADATGAFTLGTATFHWRGLASVGTSGGIAPRLCEITVVDKAKELGSNAGIAVKTEFPIAGSDSYQYTSNHHSVCDSFLLKTADAVYAVTASTDGFGGGSCPSPLKGAPAGAKGVTKFSYTYGSKTVTGSERCKHHTRSCR